ncbi:MAG TPA: hypothetical protein EYP79_04010 [Campylobacterales bacterium]|nr:hypothetical protein [Campylobacterales bacterium]
MKKNNQALDKYSILIKQILALYYSGCYINNKELQKLAKNIGIETDLTDRETMFKKILTVAIKEQKEVKFFKEISKLLKQRFDEYAKLANDYPNSNQIIKEWMHKLKSTDLLIKQRVAQSLKGRYE